MIGEDNFTYLSHTCKMAPVNETDGYPDADMHSVKSFVSARTDSSRIHRERTWISC